ncbi:hypothetical protein [Actinokineospora cianjurensis]|uniref:Uncharacterized protein n=1 Tax=Actinokineospora cianjurensis TaxID=585224 RepID=A0A421B8R7_9PSEU|nr:hypothetical protein [Actinokineospora cianjurensis]RLK60821.1 hypothetical protein CLV68_1335 [Actinokineospora cianjurensis]
MSSSRLLDTKNNAEPRGTLTPPRGLQVAGLTATLPLERAGTRPSHLLDTRNDAGRRGPHLVSADTHDGATPLDPISDRLGIAFTPLRGLQVASLAATLPLGGQA